MVMPVDGSAQAWDAFVAAAARPDFLQTWEWGELKALTGWRPHRTVARQGERPVAVCSVLERRLPGLGPLLYAPRGPIVDWNDAAAVAAIFEALRELARERRAIALKLDPAVPKASSACAQALRANGFRPLETGSGFEGVQPRFVMRLPLGGRSEEDLLAAMTSKTRYNIRLAERRGVLVRSGERADLRPFYDLLLETARRDRFVVRAFDYFERMWDTCIAPGLARLWLAELDGELLAGTIAFLIGDTAWYLYGASSGRRRDAMPSHAVQWRMIRWALASGCAVYDFRGVSGDLRPENPLYGLYRFKKGFGAELVEFVGEWDRAWRPAAYWLARRGIPLARRMLARRRSAAAAESEA